MNKVYLPTTLEGKMFRASEECGEVVHVLGKCLRFGLDDYHPKTGLLNVDALMAEVADLRHALNELEKVVTDENRPLCIYKISER